MSRLLTFLLLPFCLSLAPAQNPRRGPVEGQILDQGKPLEGARLWVDGGRHVLGGGGLSVLTGADGRFLLPLAGGPEVVVVEKDGYVRDLVPVEAFAKPLELKPHPRFRRDRVLVVRVSLPGHPAVRPEMELRRLLFGRGPGDASAAAYCYEISKGGLVLEPGGILNLTFPGPLPAQGEDAKEAVVAWVLKQLQGTSLQGLDWVDNGTGQPGADGKPDHLWIIVPGPTESVTGDERHFPARSSLEPLPWDPEKRWGVVAFTEETPVGTLVHELLHAQGEHAVDDYYVAGRADTAGRWDVMDAGLLLGWDRQHPTEGPWIQDTGYSPAWPMAFTLTECWYRGFWRDLVEVIRPDGPQWEGWLTPLQRATGAGPQALRVPDPRRKGAFWELTVRRPWGFDRGRVGDRTGPGYQGLLVARIDPSRLSSDGDSRGPVRVVDAHPRTPEPPKPRFPGGRWQLDDAAFALGQGEVSRGQDGPLVWEVLEEDALGRMRVKVVLRAPAGRTK